MKHIDGWWLVLSGQCLDYYTTSLAVNVTEHTHLINVSILMVLSPCPSPGAIATRGETIQKTKTENVNVCTIMKAPY